MYNLEIQWPEVARILEKPRRKIFYIDVGGMPLKEAEQYVEQQWKLIRRGSA